MLFNHYDMRARFILFGFCVFFLRGLFLQMDNNRVQSNNLAATITAPTPAQLNNIEVPD